MVTPLRVLVKSPFSMYSGYGQDGFGIARALMRWGCDVYVQPTWLDTPIPRDLLPLFGKTLEPPWDLIINHWDPSNLGINVEARKCARLAVAWTMWEFAPAPGPVQMKRTNRKTGETTEYTARPKSGLVPICRGRDSLAERLKWYDLVLGYDPVSLASLDPYIPRHVARGVLIGGYESSEWAKSPNRDWFRDDDFMFGMHGALNNRKQPYLVLEAFRHLKYEHPKEFAGARLGFHTTTPPLFPEMNEMFRQDRVKVWFETWDHARLQEFYNHCHCLVYPSHGEGKNVPALELMTTGGTVIHTNYGGPQTWLRDDIAYPLDYTLVPVLDKRPDAAHWAQVDLESVKAAMWHVFTHREEARNKGELASRLIPSQLDWSVVAEDLFRRIRDLVPHNGELIWNLAQECKRETASPELAPWMR